LNGAVELLDLGLAVTGPDRFGHAVLRVVGEKKERDALERGFDRADLRQDVDAVAVIVDHLLQAPDLAFDSLQAALDVRLVI